MEAADPPELRRHARIARELPIRLVDSHSNLVDGNAAVCDASPAGLGLRSHFSPPVGETLRFSLHLPGGQSVRGDARVRWTFPEGAGYLLGLQIVELAWWQRVRLLRYLSPERFWFLKAADNVLPCAVALTVVLVFRDIWLHNPAFRNAVINALPYALIGAAPILGVFAMLRSRS